MIYEIFCGCFCTAQTFTGNQTDQICSEKLGFSKELGGLNGFVDVNADAEDDDGYDQMKMEN